MHGLNRYSERMLIPYRSAIHRYWGSTNARSFTPFSRTMIAIVAPASISTCPSDRGRARHRSTKRMRTTASWATSRRFVRAAAALTGFFGGSSDAAIAVAGKYADVLALWGESLAAVGETISKVREAVALHGRETYIRVSLSLRPIIAPTEDGAWSRTESILARAKRRRRRVAEFHAPAKGPDERRCAVSLAETAKGSSSTSGCGQALLN